MQNKNDFFSRFACRRQYGKREKEYLTSFTTYCLIKEKNTGAEARRDAAKAGTQVYAQLVASSYGMVNASAGISGSASMSVGYSYGGDVSGAVSPVQSIG